MNKSPGPPEAIEIRFLAGGDIAALLELWRAAGLPFRPAGRDHPDRLLLELLAYPRNFIGAFWEGQLRGAVLANWDGRRGWINRLAVHPEERRKGLARLLIAQAETELKSRGAVVIAALVEPGNVPSLSLFAALGYQDEPIWSSCPNGTGRMSEPATIAIPAKRCGRTPHAHA